MKKLIILLLTIILLAACGKVELIDKADSASKEESQEELNAKLKEETKHYSFVELNNEKVEKNTKVKLTGEITVITKEGMLGEFTLTTEEGDGFGIYSIVNVLGVEVQEGSTVTVYGTYNGKNELSMPEILVTLIE